MFSFTLQLVEPPCHPLVMIYLITHNITLNLYPITTNVTLYGVQPGETYTVEITPYVLFREGKPEMFAFSKDVIAIHYACKYLLKVNIYNSLVDNRCATQVSQQGVKFSNTRI